LVLLTLAFFAEQHSTELLGIIFFLTGKPFLERTFMPGERGIDALPAGHPMMLGLVTSSIGIPISAPWRNVNPSS
jgi:hypothetical protein